MLLLSCLGFLVPSPCRRIFVTHKTPARSNCKVSVRFIKAGCAVLLKAVHPAFQLSTCSNGLAANGSHPDCSASVRLPSCCGGVVAPSDPRATGNCRGSKPNLLKPKHSLWQVPAGGNTPPRGDAHVQHKKEHKTPAIPRRAIRQNVEYTFSYFLL